jgi:hypothetical protein
VLVRTTDEGALAIGQLSHAWVSGQLARRWGNELVLPAEPFEEVVLGAEQHDIGWALFDLEPRFNDQSGMPRSFLEMTVDEHLAIWRDAPERLLSQSSHAALVVSMHGSSLSELRARVAPDQADALREHIDREHARQARLRATLRLSEHQAEITRRQMWTWDGLSLALCMAWRPFTAREVPSRDAMIDIELRDLAEGVSTLDPWPFAVEQLELHCEARRLAAPYESEAQMRAAFERIPPTPLTFTLQKG